MSEFEGVKKNQTFFGEYNKLFKRDIKFTLKA